MSDYYTLDAGGNAVPSESWPSLTNAQRCVARDEVLPGVVVSTVFLPADHAWDGGPPVLWETMIFGGPHSDYQERYTSRQAAVDGHARAVALARSPKEAS